MTTKPANIDEYIANFSKNIQDILEEIRATIKQAAPTAEEAISYAIPAFNLNKKYLVYFAAFKNHIGFYPAPTSNKFFEKDLSSFKTGKGSVQFPIDKPMPKELITKIVKFRIEEIAKKEKTKKTTL